MTNRLDAAYNEPDWEEEAVRERVSMSGVELEEQEFVEGAGRVWWLFLITGILWLWVALIVLRLNLESVTAISILFGLVAIGAGINEFFSMPSSSSGWMIGHGLLGVVFVLAGIVAFFRPAGTFVALAAIVGWVLLFKGVFDVIVALAGRGTEMWWLLLILGIAQILLAFWAVGYFRGSAILLVVWIGALALTRGITEILLAFRLRGLRKALAAR